MAKFNLEGFLGVNYLPVSLELLEYITQDIFTIRDTNISQRVINHWDKEGLLPPNNRLENTWRRFSFIDFVWLKLIEELRSVGTSLPTIKTLRNELFQQVSQKEIKEVIELHPHILDNLPDDEYKEAIINLFKSKDYDQIKNEVGYSIFHFLLTDTISKKEFISILIFSDGSSIVWNENHKELYDQEDINKRLLETHISVSLMKIVKDFIKSDHNLALTPKLKLLEEHELKLLEIINGGNFESLSITLLSGENIVFNKQDLTWRKAIDILTSNEYRDIEINSKKGIIMKIHNTKV